MQLFNIKPLNKLLALASLFTIFTTPVFANNLPTSSQSLQNKMTQMELTYGGKISFSAINTSDNKRLKYNANERFPMCSTYKFMLVAAVLKKSMKNPAFLQKQVLYDQDDLITYSPVTKEHLSAGMSIEALCYAAILSDNTAANLLIKELGGITSVNKFARSIDDVSFRLDRVEPDVNTAIPGDLRDTTTAHAMTNDLHGIVLGEVLDSVTRKKIQEWLINNTTGNARIRAATPKTWFVGDKTGTCSYGTTNDIAIVWPKNCSPIAITIFFTQPGKDALPQDKVIEMVAGTVLNEFAKTDSCLLNAMM